MKRKRNWVIGMILTATAGFFALQYGIAPLQNEAAQTSNITLTSTIENTDTPAYEGCAYMWAYHDYPELTEKLDTAVRVINPDASIKAELFGEDCVYADGHSTFGAMETDFYVQLPVDDLTNEEAFGNWISQILKVVLDLPREEIQGNYGFVEFRFEKTETDHVIVRVPIQLYINNARGLTGAALFQMFHNFP